MLRAIMHFRDQMIHVLEKENLGDPAQALHDLGSLIKDKVEIFYQFQISLLRNGHLIFVSLMYEKKKITELLYV